VTTDQRDTTWRWIVGGLLFALFALSSFVWAGTVTSVSTLGADVAEHDTRIAVVEGEIDHVQEHVELFRLQMAEINAKLNELLRR